MKICQRYTFQQKLKVRVCCCLSYFIQHAVKLLLFLDIRYIVTRRYLFLSLDVVGVTGISDHDPSFPIITGVSNSSVMLFHSQIARP